MCHLDHAVMPVCRYAGMIKSIFKASKKTCQLPLKHAKNGPGHVHVHVHGQKCMYNGKKCAGAILHHVFRPKIRPCFLVLLKLVFRPNWHVWVPLSMFYSENGMSFSSMCVIWIMPSCRYAGMPVCRFAGMPAWSSQFLKQVKRHVKCL